MPLLRFEIRNEYGLGDPELYSGSGAEKDGPKKILDGVAVAGLVGILRQLGDVAEFAAEIFHGLHEQVISTSSRGHKLLARIKRLEATIPSIEDGARGRGSYIDFAYESGSSWHMDLKNKESHLCSSGLPHYMIESYEECRDPPRLYLLDKYDSSGIGACSKKYSDPSYFKRAWSTSEHQTAQSFQRMTNADKTKRNSSWLRNGVQHTVSASRGNSSLTSSTRFTFQSPDDRSFSAENPFICEMRLKPVVMNGSPLLNSMTTKFCAEKISKNPSSMIDDLEYDRSSCCNLDGNHDGRDEELANDDSQFDFPRTKSPSPLVICDKKPEKMKISCSERSLTGQESTETGTLDQPNSFPVIDEVISDADSYVDAFNTLEFEVEMDSDCQAKLGIKGRCSHEYGISEIPRSYSFSGDDVPTVLHGSEIKFSSPSDSKLDSPTTSQIKQPISEACFSAESCKDGNQTGISDIPAKLWTNGYLLGLEPSKPPEISPQCGTRERDRNEYGLLKKSSSISSHYSDHSSPPLEHMKIAFHPMNDLEISSLKLDFPDESIKESIDGIVVPSIRLFPGCALSKQDGVSDSDEDTFCRSCPYSSEGLISSHSDSNSELWEQDDWQMGRTNEISSDFHRMFSSAEDVITIPAYSSIMMPPPPPLPPIQWRLPKPNIDEAVFSECFHEQNTPDPSKSKNTNPSSPFGKDGHHNKMQHDPLKPEVHLHPSVSLEEDENCRRKQLSHQMKDKNRVNSDERGDLLQQIRSKTFNLRRTVSPRPSFTPQTMTSGKVAALLQKANAIRQACASSQEEEEEDDDDDDDDWDDD